MNIIPKNDCNTPRRSVKLSTELVLLSAYLIMCLIFSLASPYFLSLNNFLNIGLYGSIMGIAAVGMTLVLLTGNIDVSIGSVMGLTGVTMATLLQRNVPLPVAIIIGLSIGAFGGFVNGIFVTRLRINSLIVTLSTMAILRGLAFVLCGGLSIVITDVGFRWFGRDYVLNIPVSLLLMVIFYIVFAYILKNTKFGRRVYAVGGNSRASYLSGINIKHVQVWVFTISGLAAAVGGFLMAAQTGSGLPQAGTGLELDVIAAAVLGGTSLSGGKGKIVGTLLGVMIMSTLSNGMVLMNVPSFYQQIAKGCVLLIAVFLDSLRMGNKD